MCSALSRVILYWGNAFLRLCVNTVSESFSDGFHAKTQRRKVCLLILDYDHMQLAWSVHPDRERQFDIRSS